MMNSIGQKFGRLTIVAAAGRAPDRHALVEVLCDCGESKVVLLTSIRTGKTTSCGCFHKEQLGQRRRTHGEGGISGTKHRTPEYHTWLGIKQRCYNEAAQYFENYGGRGIVVCEGWRNSFEKFLADMGRRPSVKHSIDRRNNDGNYSCGSCGECVEKGWPMNCRWATPSQQAFNRRPKLIQRRKAA